jgi:hypothetical protein
MIYWYLLMIMYHQKELQIEEVYPGRNQKYQLLLLRMGLLMNNLVRI